MALPPEPLPDILAGLVPTPQELVVTPDEFANENLPALGTELPVEPQEPPGTIDETEEGITTVSGLLRGFGRGKPVTRLGMPVIGGNLHVTVRGKDVKIPAALLDDPEGFIAFFKGQTIGTPEVTAAKRGVLSRAQLRSMAEDLGVTEDEIRSSPLGTVLSPEVAQFAVDTRKALLHQLKQVGRDFSAGTISEEVLHDTFVSAVKFNQKLLGVSSELGRSLWVFRQGAREGEQLAALGAAEPSFIKDPQRLAYALAHLSDEGLAWTITGVSRRGWEWLTSAWFQGMLSLPSTQLANIFGNSGLVGVEIFDRLLGAGFGAAMGHQNIPWVELVARMRGMVGGTVQALLGARNTHMTGISRFGATKFGGVTVQDPAWLESPVGQMYNYIAMMSPMRLLHTADEMFKINAETSHVWGMAAREFAQERGGWRSLKDLFKRDPGEQWAEIFKRTATNPDVDQAAGEFAHYMTFTRPLEGLMAPLHQVLSHPALRPVSPFYRILTNIARFNFEHFPVLGMLARDNRDKIGEAVRLGQRTAESDFVAGRQLLGSGVFAFIAMGAQAGIFTGAGPTDPKRRALKEAGTEGWRPFSVYFGPNVGYLSYDRFGLLGSLVGMVASYTEISGELNADQLDEVATAIHLAYSKDLEDNTFVGDIGEMLEGVLKKRPTPDEPWFQKLATTAVPNIAKGIRKELDPVKREANTMLERFQNVIPYWSKGLKPDVNYVGDDVLIDLGLPPWMSLFAPFKRGAPKPNDITAKIMDETYRLDIVIEPVSPAFFGPEDKQFGAPKRLPGITLTDDATYEYRKLAGNGTKFVDGVTFSKHFGVRAGAGKLGLKDTLEKLLESPVYAKLTDGPQGGKAAIWLMFAAGARSAARMDMMTKHPELMRAYIEREGERAILLGGEDVRAEVEGAVKSAIQRMTETLGR